MLRSESREFFPRTGSGCTPCEYQWGPEQVHAESPSKTRGPKTNWFGRKKIARPIFDHYFVPPSTSILRILYSCAAVQPRYRYGSTCTTVHCVQVAGTVTKHLPVANCQWWAVMKAQLLKDAVASKLELDRQIAANAEAQNAALRRLLDDAKWAQRLHLVRSAQKLQTTASLVDGLREQALAEARASSSAAAEPVSAHEEPAVRKLRAEHRLEIGRQQAEHAAELNRLEERHASSKQQIADLKKQVLSLKGQLLAGRPLPPAQKTPPRVPSQTPSLATPVPADDGSRPPQMTTGAAQVRYASPASIAVSASMVLRQLDEKWRHLAELKARRPPEQPATAGGKGP
eukprot:SAG22_NODE_255_length_13562_cov_6.101463_5_plen_344_part_00